MGKLERERGERERERRERERRERRERERGEREEREREERAVHIFGILQMVAKLVVKLVRYKNHKVPISLSAPNHRSCEIAWFVAILQKSRQNRSAHANFKALVCEVAIPLF